MFAWVSEEIARALHSELLLEHGGLPGPSRNGALESALARPQNLVTYADTPPALHELAACYGYGLARDHTFPDGNKRLALSVIDVFLQLNGYELTADEPSAAATIKGVAAGSITESELAEWIAANWAPIS